MRTKREVAIEREFNNLEKSALSAASQLLVAINTAEILTPWLHHSVVNGTGDVEEVHRAEFSDSMIQVFSNIQECLGKLTPLYEMYDADPVIYKAKVDQYIIDNPDILALAESRIKV